MSEIGATEIGMVESSALQIRFAEIGAIEARMHKIRAGEIGGLKIGRNNVAKRSTASWRRANFRLMGARLAPPNSRSLAASTIPERWGMVAGRFLRQAFQAADPLRKIST